MEKVAKLKFRFCELPWQLSHAVEPWETRRLAAASVLLSLMDGGQGP